MSEVAPRQMRMSWSTDAGQVDFTFPSNLSAEDVEDVEDLVRNMLAGARRRAEQAAAIRALGEKG